MVLIEYATRNKYPMLLTTQTGLLSYVSLTTNPYLQGEKKVLTATKKSSVVLQS